MLVYLCVGGENGNVDSELIKKRSPILHKYLNDKMLELQALYALQALVHRRDHPQGQYANDMCCRIYWQ